MIVGFVLLYKPPPPKKKIVHFTKKKPAATMSDAQLSFEESPHLLNFLEKFIDCYKHALPNYSPQIKLDECSVTHVTPMLRALYAETLHKIVKYITPTDEDADAATKMLRKNFDINPGEQLLQGHYLDRQTGKTLANIMLAATVATMARRGNAEKSTKLNIQYITSYIIEQELGSNIFGHFFSSNKSCRSLHRLTCMRYFLNALHFLNKECEPNKKFETIEFTNQYGIRVFVDFNENSDIPHPKISWMEFRVRVD